MKNSLASLCFTVHHEKDEPTAGEFHLSLLNRIVDLVRNDEWIEACDFTDTMESDPVRFPNPKA
jgi:hypothetical protein